jgi:hypothetical protein
LLVGLFSDAFLLRNEGQAVDVDGRIGGSPSSSDDISSSPLFFQVLVDGNGRKAMIWPEDLGL